MHLQKDLRSLVVLGGLSGNPAFYNQPGVKPKQAGKYTTAPGLPCRQANRFGMHPADSVHFSGLFSPRALTWTVVKQYTDPLVGDVEIYRFSNGLEFYGIKRKGHPMACIGQVVKTGSINETDDNNGISHFLEHLIFKGTPDLKPGEFERQISKMGGVENASTSYDKTFYYVENLQSQYLAKAIQLQAELLQNALIPPGELEKERNVILEEINQTLDDKKSLLSYGLRQALWPGHPYERTILGPKHNIQSMTRDEILDYYRKYYQPGNIALLVVGDYDTNQVLNTIAQSYNRFPSNTTRHEHSKTPERRPSDPSQSRPNHPNIIQDKTIQNVYMHQGFEGPRCSVPGYFKRAVSLRILANILHRNFRTKFQTNLNLAQELQVEYLVNKERAYLAIKTRANPDKIKALRQGILDELPDFAQNGITPESFDIAKKIVKNSLLNDNETQSMILEGLADSIASWGHIENAFGGELNCLDSITIDDIRNLARDYLKPSAEKAVFLAPEGLTDVDELPAQNSVHPAVRFGGSLRATDCVKKLSNGAEVVIRHRPEDRKTSITLTVKGGKRLEKVPGESKMLEELFLRSLGTLKTQDLSEHLRDYDLKYHVNTFPDNFAFSIEGPNASQENMFEILHHVLEGPMQDERTFELIKNKIKSDFNAKLEQDPSYLTKALLARALCPEDHPYGDTELSLIHNLDKITLTGVKDLFNRMFTAPNIEITAVGNISPVQTMAECERLLSPVSTVQCPIPAFSPIPALQNKVVAQAVEGVSQLKLRQGWLVPGKNSPDYAAMMILNNILHGSMSSRLFQTFREGKKAYCYHCGSFYQPFQNAGFFQFYIETSPENFHTVQALWQKEIDKLINTQPSKDEMERALNLTKSWLIKYSEKANDDSTYIASHRSLDTPSMEDQIKALEAVRPQDILRVARQYLTQNSVTAITAPITVLEQFNLPITSEAL